MVQNDTGSQLNIGLSERTTMLTEGQRLPSAVHAGLDIIRYIKCINLITLAPITQTGNTEWAIYNALDILYGPKYQ